MAILQWNVKRVRFVVAILSGGFLILYLYWSQFDYLKWDSLYSQQDQSADKLDDFKHRSNGKAEKRQLILEDQNINLNLSAGNEDDIKLNDKEILSNSKFDAKIKKTEIVMDGDSFGVGTKRNIVNNNTGDNENKPEINNKSVLIQQKIILSSTLLNQTQPDVFPIILKEIPHDAPGTNPAQHWRPPYIPLQNYVFNTDRLPKNERFMPSIGNGHVATVIHSDSVFMNGLYNGAGSNSHRARIPSTSAISIKNLEQPALRTTYALNAIQGVYAETFIGNGFEIQERIYAHRKIPQLIVTEIEIARKDTEQDIKLQLRENRGNDSKDITFQEVNSNMQKVVYKVGTINTPETDSSPRTRFHILYDEVPAELSMPANIKRCQWVFLTSIDKDKQEVFKAYQTGIDLAKQNKLLTVHIETWATVWKRGRVDVDGSVLVSKALYGSLYYLLSSVPLEEDENSMNPYFGLSPTGLAHGNKAEDYQGHILWDQETWMFPSLAILHPNIGEILLKTRIRTLEQAKKNAAQNKYSGAQFPWESAFQGVEVSPSKDCAKYEIHITGDIAMAIQQYLYLTNNTKFLSSEGGKELVMEIAKFWESRVQQNLTTGKFEILGVMGPDEYHSNVNNSAFVNSIANTSLQLGEYVNHLLGLPSVPRWKDIIQNLYMPYDKALDYHPEFDGYKYMTGYKSNVSKVKQADAILLGYPLQQSMTSTTRRNDLANYEKVTDITGPSMTWGMFSIGWLELKDYEKAEQMFIRKYSNLQQPFQIWTENADGTGAVNFLTGMGEFLQNVIFGYGGFRFQEDRLDFNPVLPPSIKTFNITGIKYLGSSLDFVIAESSFTVILTETLQTIPNPFVYIYSLKWTEPLKLKEPVSFQKLKAAILPGQR